MMLWPIPEPEPEPEPVAPEPEFIFDPSPIPPPTDSDIIDIDALLSGVKKSKSTKEKGKPEAVQCMITFTNLLQQTLRRPKSRVALHLGCLEDRPIEVDRR